MFKKRFLSPKITIKVNVIKKFVKNVIKTLKPYPVLLTFDVG